MIARISPRRAVVAIAMSAITFVALNAFAASNTVPTTTAGSGAGTISGYTVSSVAYSLNATTPTNVDAVTFTLSATAGTVKIKLTAAGSTFYSCTNTSGNNWSCGTTSPQATVSAADELTVVATA